MTTYLRLYGEDVSVQPKTLGRFSEYAFSVKDIFCVKGYPCSWGIKPLYLKKAEDNAELVEQLTKAGACLIGATNLSPLSLDICPQNPFFGNAVIPTVLGSSFGAALSIVNSDSTIPTVDFAFGSDSGGSIRAPAASISAIGFKGSSKFFPRDGVLLLGTSMDSIGFICRTFSVLRDVLDFFSGEREYDGIESGESVTELLVPHPDDLWKYCPKSADIFMNAHPALERIAPIKILEKNFFERINVYRTQVLSRMYRSLLENELVQEASGVMPQLLALKAYADRLDAGGIKETPMNELKPERFSKGSVLIHPTLTEDLSSPNTFLSVANVFDLHSISVPSHANHSFCISGPGSPYPLVFIAEKLTATNFS